MSETKEMILEYLEDRMAEYEDTTNNMPTDIYEMYCHIYQEMQGEDNQMNNIEDLILAEKERAMKIYGKTFASAHEAESVIREEVEEARLILLGWLNEEVATDALEFIHAVEMGKAALEKQIDKEPRKGSNGDWNCPVCDELVGTDCFDKRYEKPYCENCGQAIRFE